MRSRLVAACLALTSWALPHGAALAQDFPNKPIRIVVGQGAGGGMDTLARLVGQRLSTNLGQPVLVVSAKQNIQTVPELVAFMKANPAKSNYGGSGPAFQFASELFRLKTGTPAKWLTDPGPAEAMLNLPPCALA